MSIWIVNEKTVIILLEINVVDPGFKLNVLVNQLSSGFHKLSL